MIDKDVNTFLNVPVGLLEEKVVQLELSETHLVELVERFKLISLLSIVQLVHLGVVKLMSKLLLFRHDRYLIRDNNFFDGCFSVIL